VKQDVARLVEALPGGGIFLMAGGALKLFQQPIVVSMRTDPKPKNVGSIEHTHDSVIASDARRVDRARWMHVPKSQAWVMWISLKEAIGQTCLLAYRLGKYVINRKEVVSEERVHRSFISSLRVRPSR
jgi:hypothetical protein